MSSPSDLPRPAHPASLAQLWQWAEAGWLRRLDAAFAQWVLEQDSACHASLPYVVALLCALEGRGHSCLQLDGLAQAVPGWLDWSAAAGDEAQAQAAHQALQQLRAQLPADAAHWLAVLDSPLIERVQADALVQAAAASESKAAADTAPPLVLHMQGQRPLRLYLRRYHDYECGVASALLARARPWPWPLALRHADGGGAGGAAVAEDGPAHAAWQAQLAQVLGRLFPGAAAAPGLDWQQIACALALRQRVSVITGGPGTGKTYTAARLMAAVLAMAPQPAALRIRLAAPTGKAAARLSESLQAALHTVFSDAQVAAPLRQALAAIPAARTLHSLLGAQPGTRRLRHHAANRLALDWLIVDEASMVDLQMMAALLQALPEQAHLVLLGDKDQLDSVEAGAVLGDLCRDAASGRYSQATAEHIARTTGQALPPMLLATAAAPPLAQTIAMLRESRRFGGSIGQLAQAVQQGDAQAMAQVMAALQAQPEAQRSVHWQEEAALADARRVIWPEQEQAEAAPGYAALARLLHAAPPVGDEAAHQRWVAQLLQALGRFRILCATRAGAWGVDGMNALVLELLRSAGLPVKAQGWFAGRVVMVTRNDAHLGVFNGDIGMALPGPQPGAALRVYLADGQAMPPQAGVQAARASAGAAAIRSVATSRLQHVQTAFAMTVHKSQGSEFEHVLLALPGHASPLLTRELLYTGLTRARQRLSYLSPGKGIWQQAMAQRTRRTSGLAALLHDGPPQSADARGAVVR
ncbi:exodeoxyribonuclease V subunit alpha [Vandammella animalimorsus]|uniref:RecBCD enzyme subunit RecD n=1 Tax=Vandammella animalimorsus TaxID=2029117 RepID=A0A2A2AIZ7_9BURK|nr:exodeoxyribonuclease V subunit alpha [Vandammella animalimorsus]PAT37682.1 exodeoxyribonuclease V subunit alpha [Vandammella animalimorsus]